MLNDVDFIRELVNQHHASDHSYDHFAHLTAARLVESEQLGKRRDGVIEQLF